MESFLQNDVESLADDYFASTNIICPICKETAEESAEALQNDGEDNAQPILKIKRCGHVYHAQCLTDWLASISAPEPPTCPVDREVLYGRNASASSWTAGGETPPRTASIPIRAPATTAGARARDSARISVGFGDMRRRSQSPRASLHNDDHRVDELRDFEVRVEEGRVTDVEVDCWTEGRVVVTYRDEEGVEGRFWMWMEFAVREPYMIELMRRWERENPEAGPVGLPEE